MPKIGNTYKNKISVVTLDALNNYINSEQNPEELEFKRWLKGKKLYYLNRITNAILRLHPVTNTQAIAYVAREVYTIMERDYEPTIKDNEDTQQNTDTRSSEQCI